MYLSLPKSVASPFAILRLTALLAGLSGLLAGCGQKGPLTLPKAPATLTPTSMPISTPASTPPSTPASAPAR